MEINLETSLIPKRTISVLAKRYSIILLLYAGGVYLCVTYRVSEYIPSRPALPKRIGGAEKAILDFHKEVGNVINLLLSEYRYVMLIAYCCIRCVLHA